MWISREKLEQARRGLEEALGDDPPARLLEPLGRVHRWLDEREAAARRYREAADDVARVLRRHGREDERRIAQVGSLLWRASAGDAARPWIQRALRAGPAPPWEKSGSASMSLFDWFEEAALVEGWLRDQRQPDHAELLVVLGG